MHKFFIACLLNAIFCSTSALAMTTQELATEQYFESIKNKPELLIHFLANMPKGADLHNHIGGASMAENMAQYAINDGLCIDKNTETAMIDATCPHDQLLSNIVSNPTAFDKLVDAWSMQHFSPGTETGHDHFFATFSKYGYISSHHNPDLVAEIANRAGSQHELYLELMNTLDGNASGLLGKQLGWNPDFTTMRQHLLDNGLLSIVANMSTQLSADIKQEQALMHCGKKDAQAGCQVKINYLYQVLREQPPEQVFAQLLAGFEGASRDHRIVGLNLVQPEDGVISMRDYSLQMQMIQYLHTLYPTVQVSLHAGELTSDLVPEAGLTFHIHDAVEVAQANRIGHGIDITHETNYPALLTEMATKKILVEINLQSNEDILNVSGKQHPLALYRQYHVPVTLSTDDEGVSRSNLTLQYAKAVTDQQLNYLDLKTISRNSLEYSFLSGNSLWQDNDGYRTYIDACRQDKPTKVNISRQCAHYLAQNEKAAMEWRLERSFAQFEIG